MAAKSPVTLDTIVALCKRRGFVYPSADIYGGLNGVYDFGPLGALLKKNIRNVWTQAVSNTEHEVVMLDGAILGAPDVWKASGHVENFSDPMVDCLECKHRYRTDELDLKKGCPHCGKNNWTEARQFNMMFQTNVGAAADNSSIAYLRPETAQAIFANFKNVLSTTRIKIPFGIAQIGKAFRNEITPKQFLFRMREFEQMELEFFCKMQNAQTVFEDWCNKRFAFYDSIGITKEKLRMRPHAKDELAHYSTQCTDVEYNFPFGWKELEGIAHRSNYDLNQHTKYSGKDLGVFDDATKTSYTPHVVECSVGVDRLFLTILFDAYTEDSINDDSRVLLKLHPKVAPIKAAILPLQKKLTESAKNIYRTLKQKYDVQFDVTGSIGKRYRRQDEIGTPLCITYDFDSVEQQTVTVRNRDTTKQERISIGQIEAYIKKVLNS